MAAADLPATPRSRPPRRPRGLRDHQAQRSPLLRARGNICALLATKDHVSLFLYDGAIVPDPDGIITGGHENKAARFISFYEVDKIKARPRTAMLKQIIANNRAGGWSTLKRAG